MKSITITTVLSVGLLVICPSVSAQPNETVKDKDIHVTHYEEMNYPALGRTARVDGVVVVQVKLDSEGRVEDADAISGNDVLVPDTLANVKKWRFRPNAQKTAVVVYNFTLVDAVCNYKTGIFMFKGPNLVTLTGCALPIQ